MLHAKLWETTQIEYGYARRYMPNGRERSQAHQHSGKSCQANQQGGSLSQDGIQSQTYVRLQSTRHYMGTSAEVI